MNAYQVTVSAIDEKGYVVGERSIQMLREIPDTILRGLKIASESSDDPIAANNYLVVADLVATMFKAGE